MGNLHHNRIYIRRYGSLQQGLPQLYSDLSDLKEHLEDLTFKEEKVDFICELTYVPFTTAQDSDSGKILFKICLNEEKSAYMEFNIGHSSSNAYAGVSFVTPLNASSPKTKQVSSSTGSGIGWSIGLTQYGAILTCPIVATGSSLRVENTTQNCFITVLRDVADESDITPAIFCFSHSVNLPDTDSSFSNYPFYLISNATQEVEELPGNYFRSCVTPATIPVLTPMSSKSTLHYAPHLYVKETNSSDCYGHIRLEDTYFLAGSAMCLETGERRGDT